MKSSSWFAQLIIVVLLIGAGAVLWRASEHERRVAAAERDLVTLKYADAAAAAAQPSGRLADLMPLSTAKADQRQLESTAGYWSGDYDKAIENPDAKLLAANAAFRRAREQGGSWQAVVGRLDSVVKQYADSFHQTRLSGVLADLGVTRLRIAGMMTQNCVVFTALSPAADRYEVSVLSDCTTTTDRTIHGFALHALATRVAVRSDA